MMAKSDFSSGISRDDWLAAIHEMDNQPLPSSDALTVQEFGRLLGVSRAVAYRRLMMLVEKGKAIQVTKPQRRINNGGIVIVPAYRLVKEDPPSPPKKAKDAAHRSAPKVTR